MAISWNEWRAETGHLGPRGLFAKVGRLEGIVAAVRRWAEAEEGRFVVFAPVILAGGILAWMSWPGGGPPALAMSALASLCLGGWIAAARAKTEGPRLFFRALTVFLVGMALIAVRTARIDAPLIPSGLAPVKVTGTLERLELREDDRRYTIRVQSISGLTPEELPRRVRIVWRGAPGAARPGDAVSMRASLRPPPGPAVPGGYDFSRQMRFEGIGGSGFAYAPPEVLESRGRTFKTRIEALRERVADRVVERLPGPTGAMAAALMTGKRERIPEANVEDLRDAGLAHLLAISGLHMGLVCGFLFWTLRSLLARSERLALSQPIKKWAALGALAGGAFYLALSGGAWSAQRAFIMAAIIFLAVLFDRRGISLRNAALAALVILVLRPEALLAPGFQMSFAAVVTLISAFSAIEERWPRPSDPGLLTKVLLFVTGLMMTSLLAGAATSAFAAYHFGRVASYGLLGNMLAMPIVTIAVMPAMVLAMFLMPLGLDGPVLLLVGEGLGLVLAVSAWTADLPGAVAYVPQWRPAGILAASAGLLALSLLTAPWRVAGLFLLAAALPIGLSLPKPDVFVSRDIRNVGVVAGDAGAPLAILSARRDRFSVEAWLQALGAPPDIRVQTVIAGCGEGACTAVTRRGDRVAIIESRASLLSACRAADVVILRARSAPGDAPACQAVLVALGEDGRHAPASLRRVRGAWRVEEAAY